MTGRDDAGRRARGFTLTEAVVAMFIVALALPPLIDALISISHVNEGQIERGQAANLTQSVLEQIHYRMYNGYPMAGGVPQADCRGGIKLNDSLDSRKTAFTQTPPSYLAFFYAQKETNLPVAPSAGSIQSGQGQSQFFSVFFAGPADSASTGAQSPTIQTLTSVTCGVDVLPYLDATTDTDLATKTTSQPKVDMAQIAVTMKWKDSTGKDLKRTFVTRYSRHIYETDVLASTTGL